MLLFKQLHGKDARKCGYKTIRCPWAGCQRRNKGNQKKIEREVKNKFWGEKSMKCVPVP